MNLIKCFTGFPVVEISSPSLNMKHFGQFMGLITREQLIILLVKQVHYSIHNNRWDF